MNEVIDPDRIAREAIPLNLNGMRAATRKTNVYNIHNGSEPKPVELNFVKASSLAGKPVPERRFHDEKGHIPCKGVTLLYGDGGTGKSLIALQLAISTALGRNWLGLTVRSGKAVYFSAEDPLDEMHIRTDEIATDMGVDVADMDDLDILPMSGEACVMAGDNGKGIVVATPLFTAFRDRVMAMKPAVIIIDNAIDVFAGNQNDASQVKQFMHLLSGLSYDCGCPVLLLAHPSKSGIANGTGDAGSVHWSNSARSRLYLQRVLFDNDDGVSIEDDPNARKLSRMKSNYAATGEEMDLRWQDGVIVPTNQPDDPTNGIGAADRAQRVFLHLLRWHIAKGINVSPARSVSYAPTVFAKHPQREGVTKNRFEHAMITLLDANKIRVTEHGPASKRRTHIELVEDNT